jgi:hypothetical protein
MFYPILTISLTIINNCNKYTLYAVSFCIRSKTVAILNKKPCSSPVLK